MTLHQRLHERCACAGASAGPFALPGTERKYERARPFQVRHLLLDLTLDFRAKSVAGSATLDVERVAPDAESLELDARGFEIASVELLASDKKRAVPLDFDYDGETLLVHGIGGLDQAKIRVRYRAVPSRGLYFLEPDRQVKDRPVQVWTQCQDEDARYWFPCHDKPHVKMTTELKVSVPHGFVALSNGELVSREVPRGRGARWHYHFLLDRPHPSYLVTLVVGKFAIVEDRAARLEDGRSIPIRYYVPPAERADAARSFGETPRMLELFSKLTGVPFPWSRYSQVVVSDFIFGGMENTTATTMYEHVMLDRRAALDIESNGLVAHELAHQWFGDFVTCRDWSHAWLNEGFATFFEHVEIEHRLGRDEYDYKIKSDFESYLAEAGSRYKRPIVCRDYAEPIDLFDRHLYEKGGLVLHMLRRALGDELFWRGVQRYLSTHAGGIVETNDLQRAFESVSGRSLERFFDHWVLRPAHPELKVAIKYDAGMITVGVEQKQRGGDVATFAFDLEVEVLSKDGTLSRHKKQVSEAHDALVVSSAQRPLYVAFNPELSLLADVTLEVPNDLLQGQLERGSSACVRWSAAEALGKKSDPPTLDALGRALAKQSEAWMVRAEAARALGRTRAPAALDLLTGALGTKHPKVRRAVASALGEFKSQKAFSALTRLSRGDASYLVEAEVARALGHTRQPAALKVLLGMIDRRSWADVVRSGALEGLAALRDEQGLEPVLVRTRYGYPTRGRRAAVGALADLAEGKRAREHLESLLDDRDPHLRYETARALATLGDPRSRAALRRASDGERDGRVQRRIRETLRELGEGSGERKRVAGEMEQLRSEIGELKARLAKLESRRTAKGRRPTRPASKRKRAAR